MITRISKQFRGRNKETEVTKVFCIGANKTGTTTIEQVLRSVGYQMPNQAEQEKLTVEEMYRGNYKPLLSLCHKYEAFQDLPFSSQNTYAVLDAMFPGSKFILTVRDSSTWYESLKRFHLKGILKKAGVAKVEDFNEQSFKDKEIYLEKNYCFNYAQRQAIEIIDHRISYNWSLVYQKDHCIRNYEQRNRDIIKYFHQRDDQFLVIDLSQEKDNSKIVGFLGLPDTLVSNLPHLNRSH